MDNRLASLRRTLRLHFSWLIVKLLGKDLLSKEELSELKDYGRLSLGDEVSLIERSFALGRESALSKKSEYKDLDLDKLSKLQKRKYSSVEKLAIREAKLHTARRIQRLADEASADAYNRVNKATRDLLEDVTSKDILADEVALAVAEKKTRQQLATSVANKLGRDFSSEMKKLAVTEMHRAKQRGAAMAIANKVGIYQRSEGVDSMVSVVPNKGACKDCLNLYTDEGNPRVFPLKILMAQGSNADEGVSHARGPGGLHTGWKPVMPPAHPNCYCELTYVPTGMAWENGKLKVVDEARYKESISKAYDSSTMSATIKPKGGDSYQKNEPPKPGSIPGVAAPGNTAGPGAPKGSGAATSVVTPQGSSAASTQGGGPQVEYEYWGNRGGTPDPAKGWERSQETGAWRRPMGAGGGGASEEQVDPKQAAQEQVANMLAAEDYSHDDKLDQQTMEHAERGEIISQKNIGEVKGAKKGVTEGTQKCGIKGNGFVCTKPAAKGMGGQDVQNEKTAARSFRLFGSKLCPVTGSRVKDGKLNSSQAWCNDHSPAALVLKSMNATEMIDTLKAKSPDWEKVRGQIEEMIVNDLIICNTDRHLENFLINDELDDIRAIDHGYSFSKGLNSLHVEMFDGFDSKRMHLKLDPKLNERFSNTSFGDMKKTYGSDTLEWKTAQSYMRMRYIQHVASENEGILPWDAFRGYGGGTRLNANQKWEQFVHNFIDKHVDDPNSSEYAAATAFAREGILMPSESTYSDEENRRKGNHFRYEMASRRSIAEHEQARRGETSFMADARAQYDKEDTVLRDEYTAFIDASTEESIRISEAATAAKNEYWRLETLIAEADPATTSAEEMRGLEERKALANKAYGEASAKRVEQRKKESARWDSYAQATAEVKNRIFDPITAPGQEKAFARIRAQLENHSRPISERQTLAAPPEAAVAQSAASGIERRKREEVAARMNKFEQVLKDKLKKKAG